MNMVRLPSGVSDTDKIGKPEPQGYFGSNEKGIQVVGNPTYFNSPSVPSPMTSEELRNEVKPYT